LRQTGVICGLQPVTLGIKPHGADVVLQWTQGVTSFYEVHRGPTPYFTPITSTLVITLPLSTTVYTDTGALSGPDNFYVVRSKFQDSANDLSADSNGVGKWEFPLATGN
jgi:hypothetical protein